MNVTSGEIASMRADLAAMLPDLCTIQRSATTSDGGGGQVTAWGAVVTNLPCRITLASGSASAAGNGGSNRAGDRLNDTTTHIVTVAAETDIRQGDHVLIGADTFQVLVVGNGGAWEIARHIEVRPVA